jgi:hypothetical protein
MNQHYAWIDRAEGLQPILDEDEKKVATLDSQSCRAKGPGGLRCILDAVHKGLKTSHLHRTPTGELIAFRTEKELEKVSSTIATEKEQ